jgi:type II secretory pathway predicted ATPase ExeA
LVSELDDENIVAKQLVTPNLSPEDLIIAITKLFHLHPDGNSKAAHLDEITSYIRRLHSLGKRLLLLIDEAQNLPIESIEELRMLSNIQVDGRAVIQSFLLGQTELDDILSAPQLEQFRQRVIASAKLTPLNILELSNYINYRMQKAGWQGDPLFSDEAIQAVHDYTQGIPRKINTFLDRVLLFAFLEDIEKVDAEAIKAVINEVSGELNHQDDPHAQMEVTETATGTKLRRKKQASKLDFNTDDLTGDMSESELMALTSGLSGEMSTAKMESLLESIFLMQNRSGILQIQMLKELKDKG